MEITQRHPTQETYQGLVTGAKDIAGLYDQYLGQLPKEIANNSRDNALAQLGRQSQGRRIAYCRIVGASVAACAAIAYFFSQASRYL